MFMLQLYCYGLCREGMFTNMKRFRLLLAVITLAIAMSVTAFAADGETRDFSFENSLASDLKTLGLFSGVSENDFDLERAPSRIEVLVMLIRVLGEEKAATSGEWEHPFTDVPAWADPYVGYAYENGLTKGISDTKFGTDTANAETYLTFMLRALGYSDSKGDFKWDAPEALARGLGMLPSVVDTENFLRADIVTVSYAALSMELKDSTETLAEKLIAKGMLDAETYASAYTASKLTDKENESKTILSAEDIYAECSPAVFYIEIQDKNGTPLSSGSGFFIDESGIAVTNYHVIGTAEKAVITMPGSGVKHDVTGVYYYSADHDIAVIAVEGSGFKTLDVNPLPVKGAASVYAIGSPKGLQNTISQGIVSNPRRVVSGATYIQTTAAISGGSSGGVLLNVYGEVIGITSAGYTDGQNLNFARPISYLALANTNAATPLGEYNWNYAKYSLREESYTIKAGESIAPEFDVAFYTADGTMPTLKAESDNTDVAVADIVFDDTYVGIVGIKPGTANITISDDCSNDSVTFTVTVTEGEGRELPFVEYFTKTDEVALNNGATKSVIVSYIAVGTEEDVSVSANIGDEKAAKLKNIVYADNCVSFDVTGIKNGSAEIVISAELTDDVKTVPVTVGERFYTVFDILKDYAISNGEFTDAENDADDCYNVVGRTYSEGDITNLVYYTASDKLCLRVTSSYMTGNLDIVLTRESENSGKDIDFVINYPYLGIYGRADIKNPATIGNGKSVIVKMSEFQGAGNIKAGYEQYASQLIVAVLYEFDVWFKYDIPEIDATDLGFVSLDYAAYGLAVK